ncbi:MAG: anion permease [Burkholderiales bacterium]|nr:anion permease [Burkholderiales bacterium]
MIGISARAFALPGCVAGALAVHALAPAPYAAALALFALIGGLWLTQALPLAVTALLVPVGAVALGLVAPAAALAPFANPVIFLFLGGFALAAALQRHGLDRALAGGVMRLAGGRRLGAVLLLAAMAALLSMWISNTATAAMMLPLALGLLRDDDEPADGVAVAPGAPRAAGVRDAGDAIGARERIFVLLALAYSCSIGGIATPVGSPPNAIAAAQAGIGFAQWLGFGLPAVVLLWPLMLALLWLLLRPRLGGRVELARVRLEWTRPRVLTVAIFGATVAAWIGGAPLARALGIAGESDGIVALVAIALLVGSGALGWPELERRAQWGVLLLFGGGLALSALMQASGASRFLAEGVLGLVQGAPAWLVLAGVVTFVVFLTELVSNTASAALLLPIFLPMAELLGLPAPAAAAAIAIAASCAFMLPVATPPNAIVFATDEVPQGAMMRCGLWLNLACIGAITVLAGWLWA